MRSSISRTHFLAAGFVESEEVPVSDSKNVESVRSVLDKEVVALVARAGESARIVDELLLAVAVLAVGGALIRVHAGGHVVEFAIGSAPDDGRSVEFVTKRGSTGSVHTLKRSALRGGAMAVSRPMDGFDGLAGSQAKSGAGSSERPT